MKEFIETIKRAILPLTIDTHNNECIICYKDGKIAELHLHTSFIKQFYHKGNRRDICPLQKYDELISKKFPFEPTESMLKGLYFESKILGESADGGKEYELPRDKRTGKMLSDEIRINQQIQLWPMIVEQYGLIVNSTGKDKNIQVPHCVEMSIHGHEDIKVFIHTTADLISPITAKGYEKDMCVIDIKLTTGSKGIHSTFGEFGWGDMSRIDIFQAVLYSMVYELPFAYMIFDCKKNPEYKLEPINTDTLHPDPIKANEAKIRIQEVKQTISNMIDDIILWEGNGWYTNPKSENCSKCLNIYCEEHNRIHEN